MCLVRSNVVFTIINTVAHLRLWDATVISAGEFSRCTRWVNATFLIATVPTVIFMVAFPCFEDTSAVVTTEFIWAARMMS